MSIPSPPPPHPHSLSLCCFCHFSLSCYLTAACWSPEIEAVTRNLPEGALVTALTVIPHPHLHLCREATTSPLPQGASFCKGLVTFHGAFSAPKPVSGFPVLSWQKSLLCPQRYFLWPMASAGQDLPQTQSLELSSFTLLSGRGCPLLLSPAFQSQGEGAPSRHLEE